MISFSIKILILRLEHSMALKCCDMKCKPSPSSNKYSQIHLIRILLIRNTGSDQDFTPNNPLIWLTSRLLVGHNNGLSGVNSWSLPVFHINTIWIKWIWLYMIFWHHCFLSHTARSSTWTVWTGLIGNYFYYNQQVLYGNN